MIDAEELYKAIVAIAGLVDVACPPVAKGCNTDHQVCIEIESDQSGRLMTWGRKEIFTWENKTEFIDFVTNLTKDIEL